MSNSYLSNFNIDIEIRSDDEGPTKPSVPLDFKQVSIPLELSTGSFSTKRSIYSDDGDTASSSDDSSKIS